MANPDPRFTAGEYAERLAKTRAAMAARGVDLLVVGRLDLHDDVGAPDVVCGADPGSCRLVRGVGDPELWGDTGDGGAGRK